MGLDEVRGAALHPVGVDEAQREPRIVAHRHPAPRPSLDGPARFARLRLQPAGDAEVELMVADFVAHHDPIRRAGGAGGDHRAGVAEYVLDRGVGAVGHRGQAQGVARLPVRARGERRLRRQVRQAVAARRRQGVAEDQLDAEVSVQESH